MGQPFNVVNRTGGNGVVGHSAIATAAPDGYTVGPAMVEITTRSAGAFTGDFFKEGWGFIFVPSSLRRSPNPP
jgi:tripartite-type tricarboxylate transporter receptor subunit TctC